MAFYGSLAVFIALFGTLASANNYYFQPNYRVARNVPEYVVGRVIERRAPAPQVLSVQPEPQVDQQASVVSYGNDYNPVDGSFSYGFEQTNGISNKAKGYLRDGKQVIEGSYSLVTKDGYPVSISYVADENGYNAIGDAIPTPHPAIVKALEYIKSLPVSTEEEKA